MTSIVAMVSFFDEPEAALKGVVDDLSALGVTTLVAVDGAYALFPDGEPRSPGWQHAVLRECCASRQMGFLLYEPGTTWADNEVGKRKFMLHLALSIANEGDWVAVYDADYRLVDCDRDELHSLMANPALDVIDVQFTDDPRAASSWHRMRMFLRATPGLRMGRNHYTYYLPPDDRTSQVLPRGAGQVDVPWAGELHGTRVAHRSWARDQNRHARQVTYYERRDATQIEA
jgi:hypothetical protein